MKQLKKVTGVFTMVALLLALSSCHRGYGCPTDLKSVVKAVKHFSR